MTLRGTMSRGRRRGSLLLAALVAAALGVSLLLPKSWASSGPPRVRTGLVVQQDLATRLRVFGEAGDYKAESRELTLIVRKRDGWLVDLWRKRALLPTVEQLGTTTDIDALWQLYPVVRVGKTDHPVMASRIAIVGDAVEVEGTAVVGKTTYRAVTRHELHPNEPKLRLVTRWSVEGGGASLGVGLGDSLRWGNVQYFVEGVRTPRMKFKGKARWIGRRGAQGDLLLRAADGAPLLVDYGAKFRGFQGTITALYSQRGIPASGEATTTRELSFEPLPLPEDRPPAVTGTLSAKLVDEAGRALPGKVRIDRVGRKTPLFGDDGGLDGADRFAWTGNGQYERALEPGRYSLFFTAGYERAALQRTVDVRPGQTAHVEASLPRVIDTPGWVAADLHLHQAPSVDADIGLAERVISIVAEGVEVAVATDHYVVTDLAPTVRALRRDGLLASPLSTIAGCEVSTLGHRFGHFNVFPLPSRANVVHWNTTPSALFADARKKSPSGIIQVNHPRWDPALGYFSYYGKSEQTADFVRAGYDPNYDAIEVYNGDDARDLRKVRQVLADWMHLLGSGRRYVGTGSSDSHKLAFLDPGLPRTMIRHGAGTSDATDVSAPVEKVLAALKAGRAIVTSGPILDVDVNGAGPGETAAGVGRRATVNVRVRAAPWVDVRSVEVLMGRTAKRVHFSNVPRSKATLRFERTIDVSVSEPTFVVVTAQGEWGLPNASREATQPFAFSNPIWLSP